MGDDVLKRTAKLIQFNIRASDYVVRIGVEEILVFMPNANKEEGEILAEKIRSKLAASNHPKVGLLTAIFGVVERWFEEDCFTFYSCIDLALYQAKQNKNTNYSLYNFSKGAIKIKIIISPTMKMKEENEGFPHGRLPFFQEDTEKLLKQLKNMSDEELKPIWQTSDKLTQLNIERIRGMDLEKNLTPAILSFQGLQYQYIGAQVLTNEELAYLEEHLYIISGFYGLLKPLDGIVPYRLEMKSVLKDCQYRSLYDFWEGKIARKIQSESSTILNLASKEYSQAIIKHLTEDAEVIDFVFGEVINGKVKQKATLLKMARGEMIRFLAENKVNELDQVKAFNGQCYHFSEEFSDANNFVFIKQKD